MSAKDYELVVVIDPQLEEKAQKTLLKKVESQLKKEGGKLIKPKLWGLKQLAYPLKKQTRGLYWVFNFATGSHFRNDNLNIFLNREEAVLRYLLLNI